MDGPTEACPCEPVKRCINATGATFARRLGQPLLQNVHAQAKTATTAIETSCPLDPTFAAAPWVACVPNIAGWNRQLTETPAAGSSGPSLCDSTNVHSRALVPVQLSPVM